MQEKPSALSRRGWEKTFFLTSPLIGLIEANHHPESPQGLSGFLALSSFECLQILKKTRFSSGKSSCQNMTGRKKSALKRAKIDQKAPQNHPRNRPNFIRSSSLQSFDPRAEKRDCEAVKLCNPPVISG